MNSRLFLVSMTLSAWLACPTPEATARPGSGTKPTSATVDVFDATHHWIATFTLGASTAVLAGPTRTFSEPTASAAVTHSYWVRTLPAPFSGTVNQTWLNAALAANASRLPDILGLAIQYIAGAPALFDACLSGLLTSRILYVN